MQKATIHTPAVTIGMPAYNAEKYIGLAIDSVLGQSFTDFELLVTDDGSSDRTVEIVRSYDDPRIILLPDTTNRGISYRLNQQIDRARGFYFVRMDSDDVMFPDRIRRQVEYLIANPSVDVVGSSAIVIDEYDTIIGFRRGLCVNSFREVCRRSCFTHPTVCAKTDYFRRFRYREDLSGVEDFDLWVRSYPSSRFAMLSEPLLFYRDPLKFRLSTYLYRMRQSRKMYEAEGLRKQLPVFDYYRFVGFTYLKSLLASAVSHIGLDRMMIQRRNQQDPLLVERYGHLLQQIVGKDR